MSEIDRELARWATTIAPSRVALELQWELVEDVPDFPTWVLELHVIVRVPGSDHSEYSTRRLHVFPAEQLAERQTAHRIGGLVADHLGLALNTPPVEQYGGQAGSSWLRAQPAGSPATYAATWEATWWTDDGRTDSARGAEDVSACSGDLARTRLELDLERRFPERPLTYRTSIAGSPRGSTTQSASLPPNAPPLQTIRNLAHVEPLSPARIVRAIRTHAPDASPRTLMVAFADAFGGGFVDAIETFAPIADWCAGTLDDAALDAALAPTILRGRDEWSQPWRLREAARSGSGAAAVRDQLRAGANTIRAICDVREAFGIGLAEAKVLVDDARDPANDARVDRELAQLAGQSP